MVARVQRIDVSLPGIVAIRSSVDAPYVGLKETFLLTRIETGRSEFWTHGRVWRGEPGTVIVHQPGDVHRDVLRPGPIVYQMLRLPPALVEELSGPVRVQSCLAAGDERGAALRRLHDAVAAGADPFALECALAEAMGTLRALGNPGSTPTRPVRRALAMLRERLSEAVTLDELARHAGFDKYHLCRAFRAHVGMPPHAYLTHLRILRAKELLAAGARPTDIAPQVGLYDQSQLNRHFRRIVGTTPGRFARGV